MNIRFLDEEPAQPKIRLVDEQPQQRGKYKTDALETFLQQAAGSASFGLSKHTAPLIMGLAELLMGTGGFKEGWKKQYQAQRDLPKEHPIAATAGSIAGYAIPTSAPAKIGAAATKTVAGKALPELAAKVLPKMAGAAASYAPEQAVSVMAGEKSIPEALTGTALAAVTPVAMEGTGHLMKKGGVSAMERVLKPLASKMKKAGVDATDITEDILKTPGIASKLPFKGSVSNMAKRAEALKDKINAEFSNIVQTAGNKRVDVMAAFNKAKTKVMRNLKKGTGAGEEIPLERTLNTWEESLRGIAGKKTTVPVKTALTLIEETGDKAWADKSKLPEQLSGQLATRELWKGLKSRTSEKMPELDPFFKELSKLHPIRTILEDADPRISKKDFIGFILPYALGGGMGAASSIAGGGDLKTAGLGALAGAGLYKGAQSPQTAKIAYDMGNVMLKPGLQRVGSRAVGDTYEAARNALKRRLEMEDYR